MTNKNSALTIFYLHSSIVLTFLIAAYPVYIPFCRRQTLDDPGQLPQKLEEHMLCAEQGSPSPFFIPLYFAANNNNNDNKNNKKKNNNNNNNYYNNVTEMHVC